MANDLLVQSEFTPNQVQLIKDTVAKNASDDELKLFLYRCKSMELDPLKPGQIYFIKYGSSPGSIVVGIDGFRAKADRTGKLSGIKRGVFRDDKGKCVGAWAEVYRKDWQQPAREEVSLTEYSTGKNLWATKPETMVKKVAEAAALRMAFPDSLGGIYTHEEMDQVKEKPPSIAPEQPGPNDGSQLETEYKIPFGKYKLRTLKELDLNDLRNYVNYIETKAQKEGKTIEGDVKDFLDRAIDHINEFESTLIDSPQNNEA